MTNGHYRPTSEVISVLRKIETEVQHPCRLWVDEGNGFAKAILTERLVDICPPDHSAPTDSLEVMLCQPHVQRIPTFEDVVSALQPHYASLAAASFRYVQRSFLLTGNSPAFVLETYYTSQYEIRNQDEHTKALKAQEKCLRSIQLRWRRRARQTPAPSGLERTLRRELQALLGTSLLALDGYTASAFLFEPSGTFTLAYRPKGVHNKDLSAISEFAAECHASNKPLRREEPLVAMAAVIPSNKRTSIVVVLRAKNGQSSRLLSLASFLNLLRPKKRELKKLTEKHLQKQAQSISIRFIEDSPDPIIAVNQSGTVSIFNHAAEKLFQYSKREIVGTYVALLYESEEQAKWVGRALNSAPENSIENKVVSVKAKTRVIIPISLSAKQYCDPRGTKTGSFSVFKDVRSLKKPYEEKARTNFRTLVQNSPDPTVVIDTTGRIVIFNMAAADLFDYSPEQVIGEPITMLYASDEEAKRIGYLLRKSNEQKVQNLEAQTVNQQGEVIPVSLSARLLRDDEDNISGSFGVFKDLRQIRHAEKTEVFTRLARTTGHDLKNNLQAALMNLDTIARSEVAREEGAKKLLSNLEKNIYESVESLQNLLLSGRQGAPRMAWVSVKVMLEELLRRFEGPASSRRISFCASLTGDDLEILVDKRQIYQITSNLFANSVDAIAEKWSQSDSSFEGKIEVRIECREKYCTLDWTDNGIGISRNDQAKIFDLFFTNKGSYSGNGIGLFISRSIAESHGGSIEVDSEKGHYARFLITLPRAGNHSAQYTPAIAMETGHEL